MRLLVRVPAYWLAPGLVGLLGAFPLLAGLAGLVLGLGAVAFLLLACVNARGTYHAREHVADMLPGAVVVLALVALVKGAA